MSDSTSSNQSEADMTLVRRHVQQLGEHFDTVHVFCVRHMPAELDGTVSVNIGEGNWHSRVNQIREFVIYEDERIRCAARGNIGP